MLNGETGEIDENLISWNVTQINASKIDISLNFAKPIVVSTGDFPDTLMILIFMGNYTDLNG